MKGITEDGCIDSCIKNSDAKEILNSQSDIKEKPVAIFPESRKEGSTAEVKSKKEDIQSNLIFEMQ